MVYRLFDFDYVLLVMMVYSSKINRTKIYVTKPEL